MKIYRCIIGCLLVFFLVIGVWYIVSSMNEQRSINGGTLVYKYKEQIDTTKGVEEVVTGYDLC